MPITRRTHLSTLAATGAVTLAAPMISRAWAAAKLSIAVIPIADCAPIYLGKAKGFFAKQNLDITLSTQGGGAAIIPGVLSGQLQFGFSNVPSLLIAQNKGLKFVGVAPGVSSTGVSGHDFCATLVPGDSPIKSAKDLSGKTVAVNNLNNIGEVAVRAGVGRNDLAHFVGVRVGVGERLGHGRLEAFDDVGVRIDVLRRGEVDRDHRFRRNSDKRPIYDPVAARLRDGDEWLHHPSSLNAVTGKRCRHVGKRHLDVFQAFRIAARCLQIRASRPKSPPRSFCRYGLPRLTKPRLRRWPMTRSRTG